MKAVVNHASLGIAARQRKLRSYRGHGAMKGSVEAGVMLCVAENPHGLIDQRQRRRNMQRRKMHRLLQALPDFGREKLMLAQMRSAMHHPVPDRGRPGMA